MEIDEKKITRIEVITKKSREFVKWDSKVKLEVQDEGRTLKVFVE